MEGRVYVDTVLIHSMWYYIRYGRKWLFSRPGSQKDNSEKLF